MEARVAILGGGPMGLILTDLVTRRGIPAVLWTGDKRSAERMGRTRQALVLDRPLRLADNVEVISSYSPFEQGDWHVLAALSSRQFEETMERLLSHFRKDGQHRVSVFTKGLVSASVRKKSGVLLFTDYLDRVADREGLTRFSAAAVNGPSLLQELAESQFSFFNVGAVDLDHARAVRTLLESEALHVRASRDRLGVEVAGVLKNPIAIACGIASALPDCGSNFMGELVSVGFREMMRFAVGLGANTTTLLGRSGLADVFTTSVSPHSRNRAYGFSFVEELFSGENEPGIRERLQLLVNPARVIEQQVLRSRNLVEGAFALHDILEVAREKKIELPLYSLLFDILSRREHPQALVRLLGREPREAQKALPAREKLPGLEFVKGHDFTSMLEQRIQRMIAGTPGMRSRVRRQARQIVSNLEKRVMRAQKTKNRRELEKLPQEVDLWRDLDQADHDAEAAVLDELVSFYVDEIADDFRAAMRGTLIRSLIPARFVVGGMRPGAALPYIGGFVDEVRQLAERYNVLYAPTHRSHLDSVEVAFGLQWLGLPVPRYAAGINLMTGPFWSWILKSLGAYAVDREKTRNILYLESLTAYSVLLLESGIPSLVYPEGTRSRSGAIEPVKTGLLSTALQAYRFSGREVIIVPLALSYEAIPEEVFFCGGKRQPSFSEFLSVRRKVYMDLGQPIRVSEHAGDSEPAGTLGRAIEDAWYEAQRVLPNQILARILTENELAVESKDLRALVDDFVSKHPANYLTRDSGEILSRGLKLLKQRKLVEESRGRIVGKEGAYLEYYGNMALRRSEGSRYLGVAPSAPEEDAPALQDAAPGGS